VTAVLLCLALAALAFGTVWGLLRMGVRAGDRVADTSLTAIEPALGGQGVWLTVHNPGGQAVVLGASIRRRGLRLRCEAGCFVSVPRRTSREKFLAGRQPLVCAIGGGETETVLVPGSAVTRRHAELVVAIGEADRLRVVHRAVELSRSAQPAATGAAARVPLHQRA
jgi:hypothetical protein